MIRISTILIVMLMMPLSIVAQPQSVQDEIKYAAYLVDNGKNSLAYQTLNSLIAKSPSAHEAYYLRARAYYNDGNAKSALYDIDQALKRRPTSPQYLELRGDILSSAGKYSQAAETFSKATKADGDRFTLPYKAARAFLDSEKNIEKAIQYAEKCLELAPENDSAKSIAAEAYIAADNTVDALKVINTISDRSASFFRLRGIAYCKSQLNDLSICDLNMSLDIDPSLSDIYLWRGLAYYQKGDREAAHSDWEAAIRLRQYRAKDYLQKYR